MIDLSKLKELARKATPQNLDSAQLKRDDEGYIECPHCGGEGNIEVGNDYCNYDNSAIGVQFYGIGNEHIAAEEYFRAANPAAILELIERLEAAEKRVAELEHADYLQWHLIACKNFQRAEAAEAELARRDAAAGEPVGTVIGYAVNGVVVRGNGLKIGDSVFTAAQPAALPPEAETHNAPDLGWFERNCWVAGANWMREQTKALGLKPIKLSESSVQRRAQIVRTLQSQGFTVEGE